ncbi:hypothetical protein [Mycolicibacterium wolinskyi]|uniref:hypothetical protein n=1 Tax=Mycolicibacterium wolinskyi TaxID=59750 RepID=UPI003BA9BD1D
MADELEVDSSGLRTAAFDSEQIAADVLADGAEAGPVGARPSGTGIAALDAAAAAVRQRQATRITGQSGDVSAASHSYDETDGGSAEAITSVSV